MTRNKLWIILFISTIFNLSIIGNLYAFSCTEAKQHVSVIATKVEDILANKSLSVYQRERQFERVLSSYSDFLSMARFALGKNLRKVPREKEAEYLNLAKMYVVKNIFSRLGEHRGRYYSIYSCNKKRKYIVVRGQIKESNGRTKANISWKLKKYRDNIVRVVDISVQGLWLTHQQRGLFTSIISNNKGDYRALLQYLKEETKS